MSQLIRTDTKMARNFARKFRLGSNDADELHYRDQRRSVVEAILPTGNLAHAKSVLRRDRGPGGRRGRLWMGVSAHRSIATSKRAVRIDDEISPGRFGVVMRHSVQHRRALSRLGGEQKMATDYFAPQPPRAFNLATFTPNWSSSGVTSLSMSRKH